MAQAKIGNLLIYTVDKKGKPYSDYLVKLDVYYPAYERYLPYADFAAFVYNDLGMNIFNNLPQGKYQIYVRCSRIQTEATKEIYFTPSKRISQVVITLDQQQYWK
ncbi:hypothetical protein [Rhodocytophaga aerolata]|uniref:hypothetical protein n=1 Tax=Rhodocytophaga aerolata TaxID=455078 RepID=UPI00366BB7BF